MIDLHREPTPLAGAIQTPARPSAAEEAVARLIDAEIAYHEERLDPDQHALYGSLERARTQRLLDALLAAKAVLA